MNTLTKICKRTLVVAMILVAVILGIKVVRRTFFPKARLAADHPVMRVGAKISLPGVDWSNSKQTLVLVLNKGCRFCQWSAPFYRRLATASEQKGVHLIAVFPHPVSESKQYLHDVDVPVDDVRQARPAALGVQATPTLALVDCNGIVTDLWLGQISQESESSVLSKLEDGARAADQGGLTSSLPAQQHTSRLLKPRTSAE